MRRDTAILANRPRQRGESVIKRYKSRANWRRGENSWGHRAHTGDIWRQPKLSLVYDATFLGVHRRLLRYHKTSVLSEFWRLAMIKIASLIRKSKVQKG